MSADGMFDVKRCEQCGNEYTHSMSSICPQCGHNGVWLVHDENAGDAAHEFLVIDTLTNKLADEEEIALTEEWAHGLIYCDMDGFAMMQDGSLALMDECGNVRFCPGGRFKAAWQRREER